MLLSKILDTVLARTFIGSILGRLSGVKWLHERFFWRRDDHLNQFTGVFKTYEEARRAIPVHLRRGWDDNSVVAGTSFQPSLFASLFWLSRIIETDSQVLDFGGAYGQTCRELAKRMDLPDGVEWHVVDLPAALHRGRQIADTLGRSNLHFSEEIRDVGSCDIFLSRGCLQYVNTPLLELIKELSVLPRHILLDKIPLIDGGGFITLQSLQVTASPYQIFNRDQFLEPLLVAGYEILDEWEVWELKCQIPFEPRRYLPQHTGLLLERSRI